MITPAQSVTCDRCGRPDWLPAASAQEARALLAAEGWDVEHEDVCGTCSAEDGVPLPVLVSDYLPSPVDDIEGGRPAYLMGGGL